MSEPAFEIKSVYKSYTNLKGNQARIVLHDINLTIEENEFLCILGPSGCGKTTLLNLLAGFEKPLKGEILFKGRPVTQPGPERAVMFQEFSLMPWATVQRNVVFAMNRKKYSEKERMAMALDYLDMVGLREFANSRPPSLSGGMKQRVAIARTVSMQPESMLMDEPFCNLDEQTKKHLDDEILRIWKSHRTTVVFITHSIDEALALGTRIIIMTGTPGSIKRDIHIPEGMDRDPDSKDYIALRSEIRSALMDNNQQ